MDHQFSRTELLIGKEGINKLAKAKIAVFGLGGVGSFCTEALARGGIGKLVLIDPDHVSLTNLNRQLPALYSTLGHLKTDVLAQRIRDINPLCQVETYPLAYTADSRSELISNYDYVADAIDSVRDKVDLIKSCVEQQIPIVSAMGAGRKLDPTAFVVADISDTDTCPLARAVRQRLRKHDIERGVKVVFSREQPQQYHESSVTGSISFVPPVVGMILASVIIRDLLEISLS
jgi:tRNA A37 threonylcarbamoyladenosine dehydratase